MKKIMILGASILQLPAIQKAKEMNLDVIAVDMNPEAVGFRVDGIKKEIISTIDIPAVMEAAQKHQIDGIMTLASDMPMRTVAAVAEKMNLIGIDHDTAIKATNKAEMRKALKENNVPVPMFFQVNTKEEFYNAVQKIKDAGYRCIVKPADNSGSRGIDLLNNFEQETLDRAYEYSKRSSRSGDLMVEEFMEGAEVSVETLSINGECHVIQITDKMTTGAPYFVEMGHSQPSQLPKKIKLTFSYPHLIVTKDGPKIVELGARLGGDNITTHLTPLSTGVDMVEACINIALGMSADIKKKYDKGSAIRYFSVDYGHIKDILYVEEARKITGVVQVSIVHGKGEELDGIRSSGDRVGFVITQGYNAQDAISKVEEASSIVKFELC